MLYSPHDYVKKARRRLLVPTVQNAGPGNTLTGQMVPGITGGIKERNPQQSNTQVLRLPVRQGGNYLPSGNPYQDMRFRASEDEYHARLRARLGLRG